MKRLVVLVMTAASIAVVACSDDGEDDADGVVGIALSSDPTDGIATFYSADGSGNCGFDKSPADLDVAALDFAHYNHAISCGACVEVTGPKGTVTVRVVDSCPDCKDTGANLDLSKSAFAKIDAPKNGRISITYAVVPCNVTGNIQYHFKDGSSKYWTAIQLRNHRVAVAGLEYKKGDSWVPMTRASYNYFIASKGVGDQPDGLSLRVTSVDGQTLEDTLPGQVPSNKTVSGESQFE